MQVVRQRDYPSELTESMNETGEVVDGVFTAAYLGVARKRRRQQTLIDQRLKTHHTTLAYNNVCD